MRRILILFMLCGIILSCSRKTEHQTSPRQPEPEFEALSSHAYDSLLLDTVEIAKLTVRVPATWIPVNSATLRSMQRSAARDTGQFRHEPVAAYQNDPHCRLLISTIPESAPAYEDFVWWARDLSRFYQLSRPGAKVTESWQRVDDFRILRIYAEDRTMIHVKIILDADPPVALDYSVPKSRWDEQKNAVESSIASVKRMAAVG